MRRKILQLGNFYIRVDLPIIDKFNVLLGFNYCKGMYTACIDQTMEECLNFDYAEFQVGLLFISFSFGIEQLNNEQ